MPKKNSTITLPEDMCRDLDRVSSEIAGGSFVQVDCGTPFESSAFPDSRDDFSKIRDIYGVMNGPSPIAVSLPVKDQPMWHDFPYPRDKLNESFQALGQTTGWVRFNDLDSSLGNLSITQFFNGWPRTDAELHALSRADIARIAGDQSNYDWSGIDAHVGAVARAGKSVNFRIGDGNATCKLLCEGPPLLMIHPQSSPTLVFLRGASPDVHRRVGHIPQALEVCLGFQDGERTADVGCSGCGGRRTRQKDTQMLATQHCQQDASLFDVMWLCTLRSLRLPHRHQRSIHSVEPDSAPDVHVCEGRSPCLCAGGPKE